MEIGRPQIQALAEAGTMEQTSRETTPIPDKRDEALGNYLKAFWGFSADELAILDGVILEPAASSEE
jgi:hypothetical protein